MPKLKGKFVLLWTLLVCLAGLMPQDVVGDVILDTVVSAVPGGTNYNMFVFVQDLGGPNDVVLSGGLLSVTNENSGESVPFQVIQLTPSVREIDEISTTIAPDVITPQTYSMTWSNYSTNFTFNVSPIYVIEPQGQSVFAGSNVTFTAQAVHTTGYQWTKEGTNLVENGHFVGVTNSSLTISNAQLEDAGDYIVIANHPTNPTPSVDAILGVFKPIQLGLTVSPSDGSYQLQVGNQDSSPVDDNEVSNFTICTTTNLSLSVSNWDIESATGVLTNGIYQVAFPDDGSPERFWEVSQQP